MTTCRSACVALLVLAAAAVGPGLAFLPHAGGPRRALRSECAPRATLGREACPLRPVRRTPLLSATLGLKDDTSFSRRSLLGSVCSAAVLLGASAAPTVAAAATAETGTTPAGVSYTVISPGSGSQRAVVGDLVAIRFKGMYKDNVFDDILDNPEPLYFRLGSGSVIKGIEDTLPLMPVGAKWQLEIPADQAFGKAGRAPSPGKPRIPPGAAVSYVLELSGVPGKEDDLIEVIGDE